MRANLAFDTDFREIVPLADGGEVVLRLIRAVDQQQFQTAFDKLSGRSRYRRFLHRKDELSAEELRLFTDADGWDHFAIAAFAINGRHGEGDLLGGARFYRFPDDRSSAEMAFAVVDHTQHRGISRILVTRLVAAASERGIEKLCFCVLAENTPARKLLSQWQPTLENLEEVIAGESRVPQVIRPDCADAGGEFFEHLDVLMQLFDAGAIPTVMDMTFESIDFWRTQADEMLRAHPFRDFTDRRSC